jgi:hypothetical protein
MNCFRILSEKSGIALVVALIALFLLSLIGLYMILHATMEVRISHNYESHLQASYAALAGFNHARALLRGLEFNDLLKGPDGSYSPDPSYKVRAREFSFRHPLPLGTARTLNIRDPLQNISKIPDDGVVNTGFYGGKSGVALIPIDGIGLVAPDPYGSGEIMTSRYFVKVTDNNGEDSEIEGDKEDSPFWDGDGIVIVRSLGIAKTISEGAGTVSRMNSVVVFEARFKRFSTWNPGPALIVLGNGIEAGFEGSCEISGGRFPGVGTIDPVPQDGIFPDHIIRAAAEGRATITGGGGSDPSVRDITGQIHANPDRSLLLDARYLWDFVYEQAPKFADYHFENSQLWLRGSAPYLGSYDNTMPANAPGQDPKITLVNGNLQVTGGFSGGGLLLITGDFSCSGYCAFTGLILAIGSGRVTIDGAGPGIAGGIVVASLENKGGNITFGTPGISARGNSRLESNMDAIRMAISLIPASQVGFREITNVDP